MGIIRRTARATLWIFLAAQALGLLLLPASPALAQQAPNSNFFNRERFIEEDIRRRLDADIPSEQKTLLTYGGYLIPQWQQWSVDHDAYNLTQVDARLWGQAVIDDVHRIYVRLHMNYSQFADGDSPYGWNRDFSGPNLDQGFYELSLSKLLQKYGHVTLPADVRMSVGREFMMLGNGLALSQVLDGGTFTVDNGLFRAQALLARTDHRSDNLDQSFPVADHQDRVFGGGQLSYLGLSGHTPFAYFLVQQDDTNSHPDDFQDYDYDSNYFGFGSNGEIIHNLRYGTEAVFETGSSHTIGRPGDSQIRAFAFDQLLEYYFRVKHDPVMSAEYALATGDADRAVATDTLGGNRSGRDNAFLGFGYVNTGYAFAPAFTNLQFVRLGPRFKPLPDNKFFAKLELGADYFIFDKQKAGGPVSDYRAVNDSHGLGNEVDVYANWRILSDLSLVVRYGRFWTGDAFPDADTRDFVYTGLVFSF